MRLSDATARLLPGEVLRPGYDRALRGIGMVHLGAGAFHRAHQAVYADAAMAAAGGDWRIRAVSLRSPSVRDALSPQDGLFTLEERSGEGAATRLVGSVADVLVAPERPGAVVRALANPAVSVVTLTVTEKGYHRRPAGGLDMDGEIGRELAGGPPTSIYGFLAAAVAERMRTAAGPLSLVSCDNLPGNGATLRSLLGEFLDRERPDVRAWAADNVACPDTMVDRIVPAADGELLRRTEERLGLQDRGALATERFSSWVLQDAFAGPRPAWEAGGAKFVSDVRPFERAKLRLLNATHSTFAYVGLRLGLETVDQAAADPLLAALGVRQALEESAETLPAGAGIDAASYVASMMSRFADPGIAHRLSQIATDGSQKTPQRFAEAIAERGSRELDSPLLVASLAAWIAHTAEVSVGSDPLSERFAELWRDAGGDPRGIVEGMFAVGGLPAGLRRHGIPDRLAGSLGDWLRLPPGSVLAGLLARR